MKKLMQGRTKKLIAILIILIVVAILITIYVNHGLPWKNRKAKETAQEYVSLCYSENVVIEGSPEFWRHDNVYVQQFYDPEEQLEFRVMVYPSFISSNCTDTYFTKLFKRNEEKRIRDIVNEIGLHDCKIIVRVGNDFKEAYNKELTYEENVISFKPFYWVNIKLPIEENDNSKDVRKTLLTQIMNYSVEPYEIVMEYSDKTVKYKADDIDEMNKE